MVCVIDEVGEVEPGEGRLTVAARGFAGVAVVGVPGGESLCREASWTESRRAGSGSLEAVGGAIGGALSDGEGMLATEALLRAR